MISAPIRDGAILIQGNQIAALGAKNDLLRQGADKTIDLPGHAILPGLVNPHVHLELTPPDSIPPTAAPSSQEENFVPWLKQVIAQTPADPLALNDRIQSATRAGIAQCARFGVTTIGDITRHPNLTRALLRDSSLRVISHGEVQAMAQRRGLLEPRLQSALDPAHQTSRLTIGLSPHAPYSIEPDGFRRCLHIARERGLSLTTHLAESPDESEFLESHTGPFRDLWDWLGAWDDNVPHFTGGPIRYAQSLGLLDYPTLLAHVNYCDDQELEILAASQASVVFCPRTHARFHHPPHRWQEMLARGINVAVGTDSAASSPDLNPLEDLRLLHKLWPQVPAEHLWQLITTGAARILGLSNAVGALAAGRSADLVAFPVTGDNPLTEILQTNGLPSHAWAGGKLFAPHDASASRNP